MTKTIACFAGALALVAGSAFAEKTPAEKENEARQDRRDVRAAEHADDKKLTAAARRDLDKSQARLRRDEHELSKDMQELSKDKRQLR